jgi:hypothetical protein
VIGPYSAPLQLSGDGSVAVGAHLKSYLLNRVAQLHVIAAVILRLILPEEMAIEG